MGCRSPCFACVEKHLGAAMVCLGEEESGYRRRLMIIGHLHEAERESRAWPALSRALRAARKAYQATGHPPDLDALIPLLAEARASLHPRAA